MKQVFQSLKSGLTQLEEVPCPFLSQGQILIGSSRTLISAGTERMLVDFGKANFIDKALQQPDKVKMVINKVRTDGLLSTIEAVQSKLDQPIPLGYCNAGIVLESGIDGFNPGDRVVSNGYHAEVVRIPKNLCAKIPDEVDNESAAFTVLGAIGLQGIRLINPTLGETVVVSGLGLVGLMTVQMLIANGCRVLGIDFDSGRCALAREFGAETVDLSQNQDPFAVAAIFSRGRGVDAVIVAAATQSDEVMHQAAEMCRKRGRIVLVGVVGLNLRRDDFFKKEITFQVSASYGPGRYDPDYEEKGLDYPVGFVRWTEQRNFEAVLDMMASGALNVKPLITHRFKIDNAVEAYKLLSDPKALGIVLEYPVRNEEELRQSEVQLSKANLNKRVDKVIHSGSHLDPVVAFIGAGNYASRTLIPGFKSTGVRLETLITSGGVSGVHHGRKAGFIRASTDLDALWRNEIINTVVIATRHNAHALQVQKSLESGKHVFVEKPLALNLVDLKSVEDIYRSSNDSNPRNLLLMIGFNRRFAPHVVKMKSLLTARREPKSFVITVNAGAIPSDHWTQDSNIGGGRIIGEGCHFIDLMRFLVGYPIVSYKAMMQGNAHDTSTQDDKVSIILSFEDGSFGAIHYLANGGKSFPKERVEVFCGGGVLQLDNFRVLRGFDWPGFRQMKLWKQDKGQQECVNAFVEAIRNGKESPIPSDEIFEVSRITIEIAESLHC
jgi:predicted dehydrogenase/threonine dehydrogenase-like Zn-dependent dehydrogenase